MTSCECITKRCKEKGKNDLKNIFFNLPRTAPGTICQIEIIIYIYISFLPASLKTFWLQKIQHQPL